MTGRFASFGALHALCRPVTDLHLHSTRATAAANRCYLHFHFTICHFSIVLFFAQYFKTSTSVRKTEAFFLFINAEQDLK